MMDYSKIIKEINGDNRYLIDNILDYYLIPGYYDSEEELLDALLLKGTLDEPRQSVVDKFFKVLYDKFRLYILSQENPKYDALKKYIKDNNLQSEEEIRDFFEVGVEDEAMDKLIEKFSPLQVEDDDILSLNPNKIFYANHKDVKEECRLSLSLSSEVLYYVASILYDKYGTLGIPARIELCKDGREYANLRIYTDLVNVGYIITDLEKLIDNNVKINKDIICPGVLEGNYRGKIGYTDVPVTYNQDKKEKDQLNEDEIKVGIVYDTVKEYYTRERVTSYLDYRYNVNNKIISGKDYFTTKIVNFMKNYAKEIGEEEVKLYNDFIFTADLFNTIKKNIDYIIDALYKGQNITLNVNGKEVEINYYITGFVLKDLCSNVLFACDKVSDALDKSIADKAMDKGLYSKNIKLDRTNLSKESKVSKSKDIKLDDETKLKVVDAKKAAVRDYRRLMASSLSRKEKQTTLDKLRSDYLKILKSCPVSYEDLQIVDEMDESVDYLNQNFVQRFINRKR